MGSNPSGSSMAFPRQAYWNAISVSRGERETPLPHPGIRPTSLASPAFFTTKHSSSKVSHHASPICSKKKKKQSFNNYFKLQDKTVFEARRIICICKIALPLHLLFFSGFASSFTPRDGAIRGFHALTSHTVIGSEVDIWPKPIQSVWTSGYLWGFGTPPFFWSRVCGLNVCAFVLL